MANSETRAVPRREDREIPRLHIAPAEVYQQLKNIHTLWGLDYAPLNINPDTDSGQFAEYASTILSLAVCYAPTLMSVANPLILVRDDSGFGLEASLTTLDEQPEFAADLVERESVSVVPGQLFISLGYWQDGWKHGDRRRTEHIWLSHYTVVHKFEHEPEWRC